MMVHFAGVNRLKRGEQPDWLLVLDEAALPELPSTYRSHPVLGKQRRHVTLGQSQYCWVAYEEASALIEMPRRFRWKLRQSHPKRLWLPVTRSQLQAKDFPKQFETVVQLTQKIGCELVVMFILPGASVKAVLTLHPKYTIKPIKFEQSQNRLVEQLLDLENYAAPKWSARFQATQLFLKTLLSTIKSRNIRLQLHVVGDWQRDQIQLSSKLSHAKAQQKKVLGLGFCALLIIGLGLHARAHYHQVVSIHSDVNTMLHGGKDDSAYRLLSDMQTFQRVHDNGACRFPVKNTLTCPLYHLEMALRPLMSESIRRVVVAPLDSALSHSHDKLRYRALHFFLQLDLGLTMPYAPILSDLMSELLSEALPKVYGILNTEAQGFNRLVDLYVRGTSKSERSLSQPVSPQQKEDILYFAILKSLQYKYPVVFNQKTWQKQLQPTLNRLLKSVIKSPAEQEAVMHRLRQRYFEDFLAYWQSHSTALIKGEDSAGVKTLASIHSALTEINFARGALGKNPILLPPAFLSQYRQQWLVARAEMTQTKLPAQAYLAACFSMATPCVGLNTFLDGVEDYSQGKPDILKTLLRGTVQGDLNKLTAQAAHNINQQWQHGIYPEVHRQLHYFPFSKKGENGSQAVFNKILLAEDSLYQNFMREQLGPFLQKDTFQEKTWHGTSLTLSSHAREDLLRINKLRKVLVMPETETAIRLHPMPHCQRFSLNVGDKHFVYQNGPMEWWTLNEATHQNLDISADCRGQSLNRSYQGPWGILRLLSDSQVISQHQSRVTVRLPGNASIILDIKSEKAARFREIMPVSEHFPKSLLVETGG